MITSFITKNIFFIKINNYQYTKHKDIPKKYIRPIATHRQYRPIPGLQYYSWYLTVDLWPLGGVMSKWTREDRRQARPILLQLFACRQRRPDHIHYKYFLTYNFVTRRGVGKLPSAHSVPGSTEIRVGKMAYPGYAKILEWSPNYACFNKMWDFQ